MVGDGDDRHRGARGAHGAEDDVAGLEGEREGLRDGADPRDELLRVEVEHADAGGVDDAAFLVRPGAGLELFGGRDLVAGEHERDRQKGPSGASARARNSLK